MSDRQEALIRLAFAKAILSVAGLFRRECRRWQESREDEGVSGEMPCRKIGRKLFAEDVTREVFARISARGRRAIGSR
jgi:hypothetical protein